MSLSNYEDIGFNKFLERSIGQGDTSGGQVSSGGSDINFDNAQMSGSLGDSIQVGGSNIRIDGANKRIIVSDGENDRIIIGETG